MSASDLQEKGVRIPRSPKISRPPSIEKDLVYASVAPMPNAKCAVGAACINGKLVVCGKPRLFYSAHYQLGPLK